MSNRWARRPPRSGPRSRSARTPPGSREDVGQAATRARRLSPKPPWGHRQGNIGPGPFPYNPPVLSGGSRELKSRASSSWIGKIGAFMDRAAFRPATLPDNLVTGLALVPPIAAGLVIYRVPAAEMLAIAVAAGAAGMVVAQLLWRHQRPRQLSGALIASLFGVALVGAGASLLVSVEIVVLATILELLRARYIPAIRAQAGLIAFAVVLLVTGGGPLKYLDPNGTTNRLDPIDTWYRWGRDTWEARRRRPKNRRAHDRTPGTFPTRIPSSSWKT